MVIEYVPLEFNIWLLAAHNFIGFPWRGKAFLSNIWCLSFEFIKVKEDPVSNSADSLKSFAVTVVIGRSGMVIEKQLDNTAQKLMTAGGKRFELLPFFLRSFPRSRDPVLHPYDHLCPRPALVQWGIVLWTALGKHFFLHV